MAKHHRSKGRSCAHTRLKTPERLHHAARSLKLERLEPRALLSGTGDFSLADSLGLPINSGPVAWGDFDNDDRLDMLAPGGTQNGSVYRNSAQQGFLEWGSRLGSLNVKEAAWGDYNNDGLLDILQAGYTGIGSSVAIEVYRNTGIGGFVSVPLGAPIKDMDSAFWADVDNDGRLDIITVGQGFNVLRNSGNDTFSKSFTFPGSSGSSATPGDVDGDGWIDLLVCFQNQAQVLRNNRDGTFSPAGSSFTTDGVYNSPALGDYDNDGRLDLLSSSDNGKRVFTTHVYHNDGNCNFHDTGFVFRGGDMGAAAWGDYDNDGRLDIVVAGSNQPGGIYRNAGSQGFGKTASIAELAVGDVVWGDYDRDNRLDLYLTGYRDGMPLVPVVALYHNNSASANTAPATPASLASEVLSSSAVVLSWSPASDGQTPAAGLSYNVRVGTRPGTDDVVGSIADNISGRRRLVDRGAIEATSWTLTGLTPGQTYYWSVQAVDTGFLGSPFAVEASFTVPIPAGQISGTVWNDQDGDAVRDAGEPVVPGWRIYIDANENSLFDSGEASATTDQLGKYLMTAEEGSHLVAIARPEGWTATYPVDRLGIRSAAVQAAETTSGVDFGLHAVAGFTDRGDLGIKPGSYGSVAWGDYDGDGRLDLLATDDATTPYSTTIYHNDGDHFSPIEAGITGVIMGAGRWGDYDNDGRLDFVLVGNVAYSSVAKLYRNEGNGRFSDIPTILPGVQSASVAWGDYDNDGRLDLALTGISAAGAITKVYRNTASGFVETAVALPSRYAGSAEWGDYDNDGRLDLLLAGRDDSNKDTPVAIYRNVGGGVFSPLATSLPVAGYGCARWGDYDNDGWLDVFIAGYHESNVVSKVYRNNGEGRFIEVASALRCEHDGAWGDFDNDGFLDIAVGTRSDLPDPPAVYRNNNGGFTGVNFTRNGYGYQILAWGDYDSDGALDLVTQGSYGWAVGANLRVTKIYRNNNTTTNEAPSAPSSLRAEILSPTVARLSWNRAADSATAAPGLSYNIRVGTTPGGNDVVSGMANAATGQRMLAERGAIQGTTWTIENLTPGQTYYWSVQAVDTGFLASPFAAEGQFTAREPARITGTLWNDESRDGIRDVNEPGLAGWVVRLVGAGDWTSAVRQTTTDSQGNYTFSELEPGNYEVVPLQPADWLATSSVEPPPVPTLLASAGESYVLADPNLSGDGRFVAWGDYISYPGVPGKYFRWITQHEASIYDRVANKRLHYVASDVDNDYSELYYSAGVKRNALSDDGRWLAFMTYSGIELYDAATGQVQPISRSGQGGQIIGYCYEVTMTPDARLIAYTCGSPGTSRDVFVYDRLSQSTERLAVPSGNEYVYASNPDISDDGRYVSFALDSKYLRPGYRKEDIVLYDRQTDTYTVISRNPQGALANGSSAKAAISGDGRYVAFSSDASDLAAGDNNGQSDVFIYSVATGQIERIPPAIGGSGPFYTNSNPSISSDGRYVAYESDGTIYVYDRASGTAARQAYRDINTGVLASGSRPVLSGNGQYIAFVSHAALATRAGYQNVYTAATIMAPRRQVTLAAGQTLSGVDFGAAEAQCDWGDAPLGYPVTAAESGARHRIVPGGPYLGSRVDIDPDGTPSSDASAEGEDEDGIQFLTPLTGGKDATIRVTASAAGVLSGWIDLNGDKAWSPNERLSISAASVAAGTHDVTIHVPSYYQASPVGPTAARFRFASLEVPQAGGYAADGEVEDYMVVVQPILRGTSGADKYFFSSDGVSHTVTINGQTTIWPASQYFNFQFEGDNKDEITISGSADTDTATLGYGKGIVQGVGYRVEAAWFKKVVVVAGEGQNQTATIDAWHSQDIFYGLSYRSYIRYQDGRTTSAWGFDRVEGRSPGFDSKYPDYAMLYDSTDADVFEANETFSRFYSTGSGAFENVATGFEWVYAYSTAGGSAADRAVITGSAAVDSWTGMPSAGVLRYARGGLTALNGFDSYNVDGGGGWDTARLYDSAGDDLLSATATEVIWTIAGGPQFVIHDFGQTYTYATGGGFDRAMFTGGPGNDRFVAGFDCSFGYGGGALVGGRGFEHLEATAGEGTDTALLYDTAGDDVYTTMSGRINEASMRPRDGAQYLRKATGFDKYYAYATQGGFDRAELFDSPGNDTLIARPLETLLNYLDGPLAGMELRASNFDRVVASAQRGSGDLDTALLYDHATSSDTFTAERDRATMKRTTAGSWSYENTALGFDKVYATATARPDTLDVAVLAGTGLSDTIRGNGQLNDGYIQFDSLAANLVDAKGFDRLTFRLPAARQAGSRVTVRLSDTAMADLFRGDADWAELSDAATYLFRIEGLAGGPTAGDQVRLRSDAGAPAGSKDRYRLGAALDYLFAIDSGDWTKLV